MSQKDLDKKKLGDEFPAETPVKHSIIEEQVGESKRVDIEVSDENSESLDRMNFTEVETLVETNEETKHVEEDILIKNTRKYNNVTKSEEKNTTIKPFTKSKYIMLGLLAIIGMSMIVIIFFGLFGDSKDKLVRADKAVEMLYMDSEHNFLNSELTESDFLEAIKAVESLSKKNQVTYMDDYQQAELMYEAIKSLNEIYDYDDLIIRGDEVLPTNQLLVRSSVTKSCIDEKQAEFKMLFNSNMSEILSININNLYQYAYEVVSYTDIAQNSINNLPKSLANRSQLIELIKAIQAVELQLTEYTNQPKAVELYSELQDYANKVGDIIVAGLELEDYDSDFWEEVYWTDTLVFYFEGPAFSEEKLISLTFDDGPNEEFTPQLLDILAKHEVKATFYVMGAYVDEFPEVARQIVEEGHTIANHTYNHPDLSTVSDEEVIKQFTWTQESIYDVTGVWPTTYRMPFGAGGKRVNDLMPEMTSILWNIDSMDWYYQDTTLTFNHIIENLQPNSLLLMHDTHQATPDVIDLLIPVLKERGYHFVPPTEVGFDLRYYAE